MTRQPALFVSHGAPTIVIDPIPAHAFLKTALPTPRPAAILVASAHFEAPGPTLTSAARPATIYDFGGFPEALYRMTYPAPGAPKIAAHAGALLAAKGFTPRFDSGRGFDHGTWTPLMLMAPDASIPVVQVSVDPRRGARWHFAVGEALAPLRDENVLILGSGSLTHDLRGFFQKTRSERDAPEAYVSAFADWVHEKLEAGDTEALLDWLAQAPYAARNHPTPEHFLPFFVALGAAGAGTPARRLHTSFSYGVLALDAYAFDAAAA